MDITTADDELIDLSRQKWTWMSTQDTASLTALFHDEATFVHMGATFTKAQELQVIDSGAIGYRAVDIHDTSTRVVGSTGVVLTTLDLHAVVGGNEVTNPFVVTEVYVRHESTWALLQLSFTRLMTAQ